MFRFFVFAIGQGDCELSSEVEDEIERELKIYIFF